MVVCVWAFIVYPDILCTCRHVFLQYLIYLLKGVCLLHLLSENIFLYEEATDFMF